MLYSIFSDVAFFCFTELKKADNTVIMSSVIRKILMKKNVGYFASLSLFIGLSLVATIGTGVLLLNVYASENTLDDDKMFISSEILDADETRGKSISDIIEDHVKGVDPVSTEIAKSSYSLTEQDVRRIIRDELSSDPEFILDAINAFVQKKQLDEARGADEKLLSMASEITVSEGYPSTGNSDGEIEVFYYFDINCSFCKRIHPDLNRFVKSNPDVKLIHREMPILAESSRTAASIAGTLYHLYPDSYGEFHEALFTNKGTATAESVERALRGAVGEELAREVVAQSFNITEPGFAQDTANRIQATLNTATAAGITGTPFLFVKGTEVFLRGAAPDLYQQLSAAAATLRK